MQRAVGRFGSVVAGSLALAAYSCHIQQAAAESSSSVKTLFSLKVAPDKALAELRTTGVVVLRNNVLPEAVLLSLATSSSSSTMMGIKSVTAGRFHKNLLDNDEVVDSVTECLSVIQPLLSQYIDHQKVYMSECQIVTAVGSSSAKDQPWHRDNYSPSLSLFIPLGPVNASNGATEVIHGSHGDDFSNWSKKTQPEMELGDVMILDGRSIHRGRANYSDGIRQILVVRYDTVGNKVPRRGFDDIIKMMQVRLKVWWWECGLG